MNQKEKIVKLLKDMYPGCKTRIVMGTESCDLRVIHNSFAGKRIFVRIFEVLELVEKSVKGKMFTIEPLTQEEWDSRRW